MKKIVRLTEADLVRLVKRVISEQEVKVGDTINLYTYPNESNSFFFFTISYRQQNASLEFSVLNKSKRLTYLSNYSVRAEAQRLQAEGVDILIALGHSGYELDQQLAEEVEEIDVVVGGHSHTFLWTGKHPL